MERNYCNYIREATDRRKVKLTQVANALICTEKYNETIWLSGKLHEFAFRVYKQSKEMVATCIRDSLKFPYFMIASERLRDEKQRKCPKEQELQGTQ